MTDDHELERNTHQEQPQQEGKEGEGMKSRASLHANFSSFQSVLERQPAVVSTYKPDEVLLRARVVEGPDSCLDRWVTVNLTIKVLVDCLPAEFKQRLREELNHEATKGKTE